MRKLILAVSVAAVVLIAPATASAKSCGTRGFDFGRVTVKTAGAASCDFGWKSYRAFRREVVRTNGDYPQWLRVKASTGKRHSLAMIDSHVNSKRADWRYTGVGNLDVRFHWVAY